MEKEMAAHSREFHGQRILADCGPWSLKEPDTTEWLTRTMNSKVLYKVLSILAITILLKFVSV